MTLKIEPQCYLKIKIKRSAHLISKYRPLCPIIGVTRNEAAARQMHLWRGLFPLHVSEPKPSSDLVQGEAWIQDVEQRVKQALENAEALGLCKKGGNVVVVTGWRGGSGNTNTLRIIKY